MCGLCGIVERGRPPDVETVARMRDVLAHRGPDGAGLFADEGVALGSQRLAVIDLSEAAMQPFATDDGTLQLVHNGEIYNYRELRAELETKGHRFRTAADTEVVLAAYREWGERCVERFNGMWAFAVWDAPRRRLFCSRDRFGVKPLYYRADAGRFVFASELKAFCADSSARSPNLRMIRAYLEQGYLDHTDETLFDGVAALPPAHSLTFDDRGVQLTRYWRLERGDPPTGDAEEAFRELFMDAVRVRLRSDVRVGTALSGGLDSSAIAGVVGKLLRDEKEAAAAAGPRQQTFTVYFEETDCDERPFAEAVAERAGAEPHWITFSADDLVETLPSIVYAQDEPFGSTSVAAQWYLMREARRSGVKVMLDGQGGDEVLAGYSVYRGARLADLLAAGRIRELHTELAAFRRIQGVGIAATGAAVARPFLPAALKWRLRGRATGARALLGARLRDVPYDEHWGYSPYRDRLRSTMHHVLAHHGLPELLHYADRNSMAHSLEARLPFLDYRLVECLFSLPPEQLISAGRTKIVLRRALRDLLPESVARRDDKLGFPTAEPRWFRGALGDLAADVFASRSFSERGFVDAAAARRRLERHRGGELNAGFELWRALNLELWARAFLDAS
jgi:asparagine synthase (glutamine-hydrolysing)